MKEHLSPRAEEAKGYVKARHPNACAYFSSLGDYPCAGHLGFEPDGQPDRGRSERYRISSITLSGIWLRLEKMTKAYEVKQNES